MPNQNLIWLEAIGVCLSIVLNQYFGAFGSPTFALLELSVLFAALGISIAMRRDSLVVHILLFSLLAIPLYGANPYAAGYFSAFTYGKFLTVAALLSLLTLHPSLSGLLVTLMLLGTTIVAAAGGHIGTFRHEVFYGVFLIVALNFRIRRLKLDLTDEACRLMERVYILLAPTAIIIQKLGLSDLRAGDTTVSFYGHWIGIVAAVSAFRLSSGQARILGTRLTYLIGSLLTTYLVYTSFQSLHYLLILMGAVIGLNSGRKSKTPLFRLVIGGIFVALFFVGIYYLNSHVAAGSWLALKVRQIFALLTFQFFGLSNSLTIRLAELQTMILGRGFGQVLLGSGIGSVYQPIGSLWQYAKFVPGTFPQSQLNSGQFQYVHMSIIMMIKWIGLIGTFISVSLLFRRVARSKVRFRNGFAVFSLAIFLLLFAATSQAGLLALVLFISSISPPRLRKRVHHPQLGYNSTSL